MNYKKILASALCLCLSAPMAMIPTVKTSALSLVDEEVQHFTDNFAYKIRGDYIEITAGMTNTEGELEIPAEIDGIPVTTIGEHGLAGLSKVTSIKLPDTITNIRKQAFAYNTALESINIPDGITEIKDEAFLNCLSLENVKLPENLTKIGVRAFYSCRKFTEITIPDSVESIGEMAFADCQGLTTVNIPAGIDKLESAVFGNCFELKSLVIPENVTFIAKDALPTKIAYLTIKNPDCEFEDGLYMYITKDCVIIAPLGSKAQKFAETYGYTYENGDEHVVLVPGDVNLDQEFNIADVVMMRNYLLGNGTLGEYQLADMDNDGEIDVFDYALMLKELANYSEILYTTKNLTVDIQSNDITGTKADKEFILSQTEFALDLFKNELKSDENTLISPYSVMQALAMTANGADGNTKTEMETVLGMPMDSLNKYLYTFRTSRSNDKYSILSTANSIWARNGIGVNKGFLQTDVDYYNADFFTAPFDDTTVKDINNWVNVKTNKMIPSIIDKIDNNTIMYLINAVSFDAKWETEFDKDMTVKADFTAIDNTTQEVDMMQNQESALYLQDENAEGIYKYYKGKRYAFVAMLPDEGISVNDYIEGMTAEKLNGLLGNSEKEIASVVIPKFSYDFDTLLNGTLSEMGMPSAFDNNTADFSNMVSGIDGNTYISRVIHKTHIDVDEGGTKAAAVTAVEAAADSLPILPEKEVVFNRPFVYFIIDTETNIPIFMGTLMSFEK